jgi:hypothetical protein
VNATQMPHAPAESHAAARTGVSAGIRTQGPRRAHRGRTGVIRIGRPPRMPWRTRALEALDLATHAINGAPLTLAVCTIGGIL